MSIQLAIATLQQYRLCKKTVSLQNKYSYEMNRRVSYLNNLIMQLTRLSRRRNVNELLLIADDINHCLLQNYYPLLPQEKETDNFNFIHTLEDVAQLIEIDANNAVAA